MCVGVLPCWMTVHHLNIVSAEAIRSSGTELELYMVASHHVSAKN